MDVTTILAIWGALISSLLLGWNIYRNLSDKGKIRVSCFIGNKIGGLSNPDKDVLVYTITNTGKKPIYIKLIGGAFTKKHFLLNSSQIPKMLQPGEYIVESTEDLSIFEKDLKHLWVIDSLDNQWKISKKNMRFLYETLKKSKAI
jgi:hypothetical protein